MFRQALNIHVEEGCTGIFFFFFTRKHIIEWVFYMIITFHILYMISFSIKLQIGIYFTEWCVKILINFKWWEYPVVYFTKSKGAVQAFLQYCTAKSSYSLRWLNGNTVWIQGGQYQLLDISVALSSLTHFAWCLHLQLWHSIYWLKDCTLLWHVLHIPFKSMVRQTGIDINPQAHGEQGEKELVTQFQSDITV